MRPVRSLLAATVAAFGLTVATATAASAAPPVGCYGLPDYPAAFFCVTTFTPTNAVGEPSYVTVPTVCAGECYGPVSIPVPAGGGGSGAIATVVYGGQTYVIAVGQVPGVPPLPGGECPGDYPVLSVETEPYVCFHESYTYYGTVWYVGTCAIGCVTFEMLATEVELQQLIDDARYAAATVLDRLSCESLNVCMD